MFEKFSRLVVVLLVAVLIAGYWLAVEKGVLSQPETGQLPGTLPEIDGRNFSSLQAAIDSVPAQGGILRLPPGKFEIEEPLRVTQSDILIRGSGTATQIVNRNEEGEPALILQHPGGENSREAELWRIQISDLRIVGNEKSGPGVDARRVNELFIDGVTVSYHGGAGIRLYYCYEDPRISASLITYNKGTGLNLIGCHDIVVSGNQFEENQDAVRCIDGYNLCMTGNNLDDHLGDGVVIENTYGSVVAGNMIEECQGHAIVLDRDCYGIALSANVIAHNVQGGIDLRDAHGSTVSANTFTILKKDALRIGPESSRIAVVGNSFADSYIGGGKFKRADDDREAAGMIIEGTSNLAITGNLFSGLRPKGFSAEGETSERVLFTNNIFADTGSEESKLEESMVNNNLTTDRD